MAFLRQQPPVLRRSAPARLRLWHTDRLTFVWLHRLFHALLGATVIFKPETPVRSHLDEVFVSIAGRQMYLWRAVDDEGELLDVLVQAGRDKDAALRLMRKLLENQRRVPTSIVTDRYRAYDAAFRDLGLSASIVGASG